MMSRSKKGYRRIMIFWAYSISNIIRLNFLFYLQVIDLVKIIMIKSFFRLPELIIIMQSIVITAIINWLRKLEISLRNIIYSSIPKS